MPTSIAYHQAGVRSTSASPTDRRRVNSRDARVSRVACTSPASAPVRERALSFTRLPDTLAALLTEIAANKERGSITDEASGLKFNFTKNDRKYDLEVKGGSIDEGTLKKLVETLDLSRFSSIKAKGAQLFLSTSPSTMNDAFSLFSRLKGQNQGKTKLESSVHLYNPSRAGHIRVEKLHHERGAQDQVEIHFLGDITNKEINDCIKKIHAQGASIKKVTRKKPEAGSKVYTLFQVRDSNVTGDSYEGSINGILNIQTLDELKELPHFIALFTNELRINLPLLGSCENKAIGNLIIKRAGECSKEVDITILKGEVNVENMKSFIESLEAPPFNLEIKACTCHTEHFPQNLDTRIAAGRPLEASKYSFIDPLGNGLIEETTDLNRVLDLRTPGLSSQGRAFRTQCSSKQEFVEMATAQALRDSAVAFDPNESEENKKRLCRAAAFNMFVEASFSEVACMGTKNVEFTSFIKSSIETRGDERGILGAADTLEISGKKILLSLGGLFRGASSFVDEHLALNLIRSSLGIDLGKNDYTPLSADQKAKYQEVLDKILRGERLGDTPRERQLENCLKQLGAIIEEKYLDSFKVFSSPSAVADRANDVSIMRGVNSPIGGIDALIKEELLNAAKEVKRMYPFLLRSRDIELLTQELVSPKEYYGHAGFNPDNVPLMNDRNRRLIAEAIKNIAYYNLLNICHLSKRRLPNYTNRLAGVDISTLIDHWSLSYRGQSILSCTTTATGYNFSTSHELSSNSQGLKSKNLAIFKAKDFLDNQIFGNPNLVKELILFPLTLIDNNVSLDFTVENVEISKLTSLPEERARYLRELKWNRPALARTENIKNTLTTKRALFDTHPLLDTSNDNGRLYANVIAGVEDIELAGDLVDVRKDDGAAIYDIDGEEVKIRSSLREYMQKFLLPDERSIPAISRVARQTEQPILEHYLGFNLKAALAEIRNDAEGITLAIDRNRVELNNRALNAGSLISLRASGVQDYEAGYIPCLYGSVLANVVGVQRLRRGVPVLAAELERAVRDFIRDTRAFDERLPLVGRGVWDIDQAVQVEALSKIFGRKIHVYNRANSDPQEANGVAGFEEQEFSGEPIRLINFNGGHYTAMLPIEER